MVDKIYKHPVLNLHVFSLGQWSVVLQYIWMLGTNIDEKTCVSELSMIT